MPVRHLGVQILNTCLTILLAVCLWAPVANASSPTVCTMTFNSPDEKNVLREIYEKQGVKFVELVPEERNDQWLNNACRSGVQCDVLLISGHYGGVFFGETSGLSLALPELEQASCRSECDGILKKPQDVFLYGCNTLAGKKQDHRSFEEYVQILVQDGFDRELAETVALTRYADLGLTMAERFSAAFANTPRIHGYSSTGPLGKQASPYLKNIFKSVSAQTLFSQGAPTKALLQSLSRSSYTVAQGDNLSGKKSLQRQLTCSASTVSDETYTSLFSEEVFKKHYDTILNLSSQAAFMTKLKKWVQLAANENLVRDRLNDLQARPEMTLGLRLKMMEFYQGLDWLTDMGALMSKRSFLKKYIQDVARDGFSYQEAEQLCGLRKHLKGIELEDSWLPPAGKSSAYLPTVQACLGEKVPSVTAPLLVPVQQCLDQAAQRGTPALRDSARWSCFNFYEKNLHLNECQIVAAAFETDSRIGLDWTCIKSFASELTVDACLTAASRNPDKSNADDMLWGCWSRLKNNRSFERSQCLQLSVNMNIHGNQLKMNWNCQNRLPQ